MESYTVTVTNGENSKTLTVMVPKDEVAGGATATSTVTSEAAGGATKAETLKVAAAGGRGAEVVTSPTLEAAAEGGELGGGAAASPAASPSSSAASGEENKEEDTNLTNEQKAKINLEKRLVQRKKAKNNGSLGGNPRKSRKQKKSSRKNKKSNKKRKQSRK